MCPLIRLPYPISEETPESGLAFVYGDRREKDENETDLEQWSHFLKLKYKKGKMGWEKKEINLFHQIKNWSINKSTFGTSMFNNVKSCSI